MPQCNINADWGILSVKTPLDELPPHVWYELVRWIETKAGIQFTVEQSETIEAWLTSLNEDG